ncbi:MAG: endonuclease MutS2, partial [Chloroflexi bacterium]|nr:endonuclease MutS2 [Chloroflexota bacterium]
MNARSLRVLEFPRILERLAEYCSFALSRERSLALTPSTDEAEVRRRQRETSEARFLLEGRPEISLGATVDLRPHLKKAAIRLPLTPVELLQVGDTLQAAWALRRPLHLARQQVPTLAEIATHLVRADPSALVEAIRRSIGERGEVLDAASPRLAAVRRELGEAQGQLLARLQRMIASPEVGAFLQEPLITQRGGRYVLPLKAEFKGRIPAVVHDQSTSGATLFVEPLAVLELNNRWRELQLEEEREVQRVLQELTAQVGERHEEIAAILEALARLDLALAKAKYSRALSGVEPIGVPFRPASRGELAHPGGTLRLRGARHPLLPPERTVPIDLYLSEEIFILIITGPNTGGKTVTLKTAGLLAAMAQSGLHIPAEEGSALSIFEGIYADIGEEQSIEQNLSTFSSHLTQIVDLLGRAGKRCLVLLDELGAGTDPLEGSALARAILEHLRQRGITTLVATHYTELKAYAQITPGVENASLEFDVETLSPTYQLTIGLPGRSNALSIASRLGLDAAIVQRAGELLTPQDRQAETYLEEIQKARQQALQARRQAESALAQARAIQREAEERLRELERSRAEILNESRRSAREELMRVRAELRQLMQEPRREVRSRAEIEASLAQLESALAPLRPSAEGAVELSVGDPVWVRGLERGGELLALLDDRKAEVQVGGYRVVLDRDDLEPAPATPRAPVEGISFHSASASRPPDELHVRGERAE